MPNVSRALNHGAAGRSEPTAKTARAFARQDADVKEAGSVSRRNALADAGERAGGTVPLPDQARIALASRV